MNLRQFLLAIRARFGVFATVLILAVVAALAVSLLLPKRYTATVSLLVDAKNSQNMSSQAPQVLNPQERLNYLQTQIDILTSDKVAHKVVQDLKLTQDPQLRATMADDGANDTVLEDRIAEMLVKKLKIETSQSNVLKASYSAGSPEMAANVVNAFAKGYLDTTLELRVDPSKQAATWFQDQVAGLKTNLETAQSQFADFQRRTGIISADDQFDVENTHLAALSDQYAKAEATRSQIVSHDQQARAFIASGGSLDRVPEVIDNPLIQKLKADQVTAEAKVHELSEQYGPNHPLYQAAVADERAKTARANAEMRKVISGIENAARQSSQQETDALNAVQAQRARVLGMKENRGQWALLKANVDSAEKAYDLAMQKYTESQVDSRAQQSNVAVLNPASVPNQASSPKLVLNLALAIILGVMLGIAAVVIMEMLDRRVRSKNDLYDAWNVPLLGELSQWRPSDVPALAGPGGGRLLPGTN